MELCISSLASVLVLASSLLLESVALEPCSNVLQSYHKINGLWEPVLAVAAPEDYVSGQDFKVEVSMAVSKKLEGLKASLELYESPGDAAAKLRAGGKLTYRVNFNVPDSEPLPRLTLVTANKALVCREEEGSGSSILQVSHVLAGQNVSLSSADASRNHDSCGLRMFAEGTRCSDAMYPLSDPKEWPWVAALISTNDNNRIAITGTLVTRSHVVTVAERFIRYPQYMNKQFLLVIFGLGDMRNYGKDPNMQAIKAKRIVTHPGVDYTFSTTTNDVAVVVLESPVLVTPHVRPACLWQDPAQTAAGKEGHVVGWDSLTQYASSFDAPAKDLGHCTLELRKKASNQTLCVGKRNGFGLCNGGIGAGLYVPERLQDGGTRWLLGAMLTYVPSRKNKPGLCNNAGHSLYQDVPKLAPWINIIINAKDTQ